MKTKRIKLFKRGEYLNIKLDKKEQKVTFEVETKGGLFTNDEVQVIMNTCDKCGKRFPTRTEKTDKCELCSIDAIPMEDVGKALSDLLDIFAKIGKDVAEEQKKEEKTTKKANTTKTNKKRSRIDFSKDKYYQYCCNRGSVMATPKNLEKYIKKATSKVVIHEFVIKALFHLVYKGSTVTAMARTFDVSEKTIERYLNYLTNMGLVFKDRNSNKYKVCPAVEVEWK